MMPIKGIEVQVTPESWSIGFGLFFTGYVPCILSLHIGPISISINRPQYFRNGAFHFEVFR